MLDPQRPLAGNWMLKPHFTGLHDEIPRQEAIEDFVVQEIEAARERGLTVTEAIDQIVEGGKTGKKHRTLQTIWGDYRRWRKWLSEQERKAMEALARKSHG